MSGRSAGDRTTAARSLRRASEHAKSRTSDRRCGATSPSRSTRPRSPIPSAGALSPASHVRAGSAGSGPTCSLRAVPSWDPGITRRGGQRNTS